MVQTCLWSRLNDLCSATAAPGMGLTCLSEAVLEEDGYFSLFLALSGDNRATSLLYKTPRKEQSIWCSCEMRLLTSLPLQHALRDRRPGQEAHSIPPVTNSKRVLLKAFLNNTHPEISMILWLLHEYYCTSERIAIAKIIGIYWIMNSRFQLQVCDRQHVQSFHLCPWSPSCPTGRVMVTHVKGILNEAILHLVPRETSLILQGSSQGWQLNEIF